ncbi:MAG: glycosyl hydrolase 115 family protein [Bacteroidetes bacterium]|nr:glycosyl hydrolase 115 family protein [Bacteroidota bacterium]
MVRILRILCCFLWFQFLYSLPFQERYIVSIKSADEFPVVERQKATPIYVSAYDYSGIQKVVRHLQKDIERVTNCTPEIVTSEKPTHDYIIIVGSCERSGLIKQLVRSKKIDLRTLYGQWETFQIRVVERPFPNVQRALVIVGSDKRGTIYGIYDLAEQMGVSPWYWWADVPPKKKNDVYVKKGIHTAGTPKVKYRGIFINDEAPALSGWAHEKFGGFNHKFYEHVFELILRLKGNFLWPAMWGRAFYDDDSLNAPLADEYGVVISTSHHEPMMRAHDEWRRYGTGPWNYEKNEEKLKEFWKRGIERMRSYESIVTVGMRGDGDEPMSEEANIALLERIVRDQRQIIQEVTGEKPENIPQVWALYKEVQEYYEKGMRVPDDITLLLCDDNWGNIRKLPSLKEKPRKGGYGIYYHFDYVGGPRNYKWLNTNQIERVWEQMHIAYEYGVRQIWIVNVGDIKPMEYPISFFLDYAWDPDKIQADDLPRYTREWVAKQFTVRYQNEIAEILELYTKYNSRRKPEMLSWDTYSLVNYREYETVVADYKILEAKAKAIDTVLPIEYRDAYYQLVLHPVEACANLYELYFTVAKNYRYSQQGRASTNDYANKVRELFYRDQEITNRYHSLGNGRWNHMMSQPHIGYTSWQQPDSNIMPAVIEIQVPENAEMGVALEGSEWWFPYNREEGTLPTFDYFNQQEYFIELFNKGRQPYMYSIATSVPWIYAIPQEGLVEKELRVKVRIDWRSVPWGYHTVPLVITGPNGANACVKACIHKPKEPVKEKYNGYVESNNYVSIEAVHYTRKINSREFQWIKIPNLGRTLSAMTIFPVTGERQQLTKNSARLEYDIYFFSTGTVEVDVYLSPTLNYTHGDGLFYGVSFDDDNPQIVSLHRNDIIADWKYPSWWNKIVSENIRVCTTQHTIHNTGDHRLKLWAITPGIVIQKVVIRTGPIGKSYLGPPESYRGGR